MKTLLAQVPGAKRVLEAGSSLLASRLMAEETPPVIFWDEGMGEQTTAMVQTAGTGAFHLVLLVSPATGKPLGQGPHLTRVEKLDFSRGSVDEYSRAQLPGLARLFDDLAAQVPDPAGSSEGSVRPPIRLVVLGASTGGPAATKKVLEGLPETFPCPIALVQHIDSGYEAGYADWLNENTPLRVRLARDDDFPQPGEVIVAPTGSHLVYQSHRFVLDDGPKIFSQKPAVDRLFTSAAPVLGSGLVGVLLTGIGLDGAQGCRTIVDSGGWTLVQDEATSTVWGMPKAAWERGAASQVLPLEDIGPQLLSLVLARLRP